MVQLPFFPLRTNHGKLNITWVDHSTPAGQTDVGSDWYMYNFNKCVYCTTIEWEISAVH